MHGRKKDSWEEKKELRWHIAEQLLVPLICENEINSRLRLNQSRKIATEIFFVRIHIHLEMSYTRNDD